MYQELVLFEHVPCHGSLFILILETHLCILTLLHYTGTCTYNMLKINKTKGPVTIKSGSKPEKIHVHIPFIIVN